MLKILQFTTVFLSLTLIIVMAVLVYTKVIANPDIVRAASGTYSETWTATNGYYGGEFASSNARIYVGLPANDSRCGYVYYSNNNISSNCFVTVTGWSVSGSITY